MECHKCGEQIDAWLVEMQILTPCDLYRPAYFKFAVSEHIHKSGCKNMDVLLESLRRLATMGIDFDQSFHVVRAVEKLAIGWKGHVPFLKTAQILSSIMMIYAIQPQDIMGIAVILEKNFKIASDSFDEEIHNLKLFLPTTRIVGISFEQAIADYKYLISTGVGPARAATDIRRKYTKIAEEARTVKIGIIAKIKKAIINKFKLIMRKGG